MKYVLAIIVFAILAYLAFDYYLEKIFECQLTQSASLLSPEGKHTAVVFDIDCGATTGYNTQLSIADPETTFDPDLTPPVLVMRGKVNLDLRWIDDTKLRVGHPRLTADGIYKQKIESSGVAIEYVAVP